MPRRPVRRAVRGIVLVEAIVALAIFAVAILGTLALQAQMVRGTSGAKYRADAVYLASDLIGQMWADVPNLASYDSAQCGSYARCSAWAAKVAALLPQGAATIAVASGDVTVTITWRPANADTHRHVATTSVRL